MGPKGRLTLTACLVTVLVTGCPQPAHPTVRKLEDTPSCAAACRKLEDMKCDIAQPLEDGTTCTKFCEDTQNNGHALKPSCILEKVSRCDEVDRLCFEN